MKELTTLSPTAFQARKAEAVRNEVMRKEISLSEFNVIDNTHIEVDGVKIELTPFAFKRLLGRLRIPTAFAKRFSDGFGTDGLQQLVQMMKTMKSSKNDQTVTLLVDPRNKVITNILPAGYASISNEAFVDFAEGYINQYGLEVKDFGSDPNGGATINCISPNGVFRVPGMSDEVFNTGVTFRNTPTRGLEVSPYLNRLVCSNGMTSTAFSETYGLHELTDKSISEFNDHMIQMASTGFQPVGLADKIKMANNTDASIAEVQRAMSTMLTADKKIDFEYMQRYLPINRVMKAYSDIGAEPSTFTTKQLQNAKSGLSIWEVVNGITNFASNDTRYNIDDHKTSNLMVSAGNLLMKKNFDTEALIQFDPFANKQLLSANESARLMGQA
tara:strand:+ start:1242 stop:2399 length:1158 start_codon:yes stop_codon:yes gene_type:complete